MSSGAPEQAQAMRPTGRGTTLRTETIGRAWLDVAQLILERGAASTWEGVALTEVEMVTLDVARPEPDDPLIARHANAEWLAWMRANFTERTRVAALGDTRSYASRLFDYAGAGRNQVDWVVEKLSRDPMTSNAAITTFEPLTDTTYIPCVSLLDFWLRSGRLELVTYAHSIDFGKKGYGNLVQLAQLQSHVAARLGKTTGALVMVVKSAHIYATELELMAGVLKAAALTSAVDNPAWSAGCPARGTASIALAACGKRLRRRHPRIAKPRA